MPNLAKRRVGIAARLPGLGEIGLSARCSALQSATVLAIGSKPRIDLPARSQCQKFPGVKSIAVV